MKALIRLTALSVIVTLSGVANADEGFNPAIPTMTKLKEGVYQYGQFFYNSLVVITDEGVMVTDPSGEPRATAMRAAIRKLTDQPVTKVIYSHDHFDHSRGGQIFKDEGAQFIAQEGCTELMNRDLEQKVVQPDVTYTDNLSVKLGGKQIDLHYYGPNDGSCMSVIHMPEDKLLYAVDWSMPGFLVASGRIIDQDYVSVLNTIKRVRKDLEFDTVINGHMPSSSPELFEQNYQFVQALFDGVWEGLQAGKTTEELKASIKLPAYGHWRGYENLPAHVERMSYSIWHGH